MTTKRHRRWMIPLVVFLLTLIPGFVDRWYLSVAREYRKNRSLSCGLARGYERQFERKEGRHPSEDEFKAWAISRFAEDVRKMKLDPERLEAGWADREKR